MQIEIRNIAIIDYTLIDFEQGFHVLTGETGAGKSIILGAIGLLSGERGQKELIRKGEDQASVKGVLALTDKNRPFVEEIIGTVHDDYITVERLLSKDGKSVAKINGKIEPIKHLREIVGESLEVCGQKSHIDLMKEAYYRDLVDSVSSPSFEKQLQAYKITYHLWKQKKAELEEWQKNDREQEQMLDLYQYQLKEIQEADLKLGEEEELTAERKRLDSFEKLNIATQKALQVMESLDEWHQVVDAVEMMADIDDEWVELKERTEQVAEEMRDIRYEIIGYSDELEYDEHRLNTLIFRDEEIKKIKRKYGNTVEEVLTYGEVIQRKLEQYERKEEVIVELTQEIQKLEATLQQEADGLHEERVACASLLSGAIQQELAELAMPHAQFQLQVGTLNAFHEHGKDDVQAYFNANKGEEMRPLNKIASGGEMARVLLAIKVVVNERMPGKTLIFDEVDEGIGGDVGRIIGEKMTRLGKQTQVIVISHLPQVAAKASHHYRIEKNIHENRTHSTIVRLTGEERVDEIARMLYGNAATAITKEQAKTMLQHKEEDEG